MDHEAQGEIAELGEQEALVFHFLLEDFCEHAAVQQVIKKQALSSLISYKLGDRISPAPSNKSVACTSISNRLIITSRKRAS